MRPKCPCKDCDDRKLLCHGACQQYKEWKDELEKEATYLRMDRDSRTNKGDQPFWKSLDKMKRR